MNGLPQLLSGIDEFQPRKVEEVINNKNIAPDTYIFHPTGGKHPFYGVPNTLSKYQQKIWPFVERIEFSKVFKSKEKLNNLRKKNLREGHDVFQINPTVSRDGYPYICLDTTRRYTRKPGGYRQRTNRKSYSEAVRIKIDLHRLVASAWVPNLENKPFVMHKDNNSTNYLIENLKWGTGSENTQGKIFRAPDTLEQKYQDLVNKGTIKG